MISIFNICFKSHLIITLLQLQRLFPKALINSSSNKLILTAAFASNYNCFTALNKKPTTTAGTTTTINTNSPVKRLFHRNRSFLHTTSLEKETEEIKAKEEIMPKYTEAKKAEILASFREKLELLELDAYIIPSDDPHLSEYVADAYARRAYVSGFTGSAGTAVILKEKDGGAFLWTDGRYFNQAGTELDPTYWTLMKDRLKDTPTIPKFLANKAKEFHSENKGIFKIGIDPFVQASSFVKELDEALTDAADDEDVEIGKIVSTATNLVDDIWTDQPPLPSSPFRVHKLEYAGMSVKDKIIKIQEKLKEEKAKLCIFSALDDIAYLFNVRAKDVECNPVGISYAIVTEDTATIYCNSEEKLATPEVIEHFKEAGVIVAPYDDIKKDVMKYAAENSKIWIDTKKTNYAITSLVPPKQIIDKTNPIVYMKACKNDIELEGMRRAHLVDGAAMAHFISWLEEEVQTRPIDEMEIDIKLLEQRAAQPGFLEPSFPTIAGVGPNGAIIHYRAHDDELLKKLDLTQPILIDSGGQYEYGTTDVTRTWFFGTDISDEFKQMYTAVLKGNIMLDTAIFPEKTPGFVLDAYARRAIWASRREYGHGTGHGVGAALNVHEGPISISPRFGNQEPLKPGMVVSNEPGYYKDGAYGIRIENLLEIEELEKLEGDDKTFMKFKSLTMIPIQTSLIKKDMMTKEEFDWLDAYHALVLEKVGPLLEDGSKGKKWLTRMCAKIDRI